MSIRMLTLSEVYVSSMRGEIRAARKVVEAARCKMGEVYEGPCVTDADEALEAALAAYDAIAGKGEG